MKKSFNYVPVILVGVLIILLTLAVFFLANIGPKDSLDWLGLTFVLFSELASFGFIVYYGQNFTGSSKNIYQSGILTVLLVYWIITVGFSFMKDEFDDYVHLYVLINILIFGITAMLAIMIFSASLRIHNSETKTDESMKFMLQLEHDLFVLKNDQSLESFRPNLNKLYDLVHYSDKVGSTMVDSQIAEVYADFKSLLYDNPQDQNESLVQFEAKIVSALKQREYELTRMKRGGI